jgi:hypothetical protein
MRFLFMSVAMVIIGSLAGCCSGGSGGRGHMHGICDCEYEDYCSSRAPWIRMGGHITTSPIAEPVPPPAKLPDGKKL